MAAVREKRQCESCGERHDLCLAEADRFDSYKDYEYVCPKTGATVRFRPTWAFPLVSPTHPAGSVPVRCITP